MLLYNFKMCANLYCVCLSGHGPVMAIFELLDYIVNEVGGSCTVAIKKMRIMASPPAA